MSDLPTLPARYPGINPPLDLEPYLLNGIRARTPGSCKAFIGPNEITYSLWIAPTGQTPTDARNIALLPEQIRPLALDQERAIHGDHLDSLVIFQPNGTIHLDTGRQRFIRDAGTLKVTLTTARRAT